MLFNNFTSASKPVPRPPNTKTNITGSATIASTRATHINTNLHTTNAKPVSFNAIEGKISRKPFFDLDKLMFYDVLKKKALVNNTIVLMSVDTGYLDMAVNFYLTSLKKFDIDNYLFVGSDPDVCVVLSRHKINCYEYKHDPDARQASVYSSVAFKRKTHLKTKMVLEALINGLNVLLTDLDIVFFKNPLPLFTCHTCDLEISSDITEVNTGFYFVRPTAAALKLHKNAWNYGRAVPGVSNQKAINMYLKKMEKSNEIKIKYLDPETYVNGKEYFDDGGRPFIGDNPCVQCVMVHNNWIYTLAAKIYRFKESGLWQYDRDGYFSNESNRYLSFDLPITSTRNSELAALRNALILGALLDRIVILPKFHNCACGCFSSCKKPPKKCSLGSLLNIETFDSHLNGKYRESEFLGHQKVPTVIKQSLSPYFVIIDLDTRVLSNIQRPLVPLHPGDPRGATTAEILAWFKHRTEAVLRFHSLYNVSFYDEDKKNHKRIMKQIDQAFQLPACIYQ